MVDVSHHVAVILCLPEGLADWMSLHPMPVISIDLHQNSKDENLFPLMKLSINPIASKKVTPASDPLQLFACTIAVYIGLFTEASICHRNERSGNAPMPWRKPGRCHFCCCQTRRVPGITKAFCIRFVASCIRMS